MKIQSSFDHLRRNERTLKTVRIAICRDVEITDEHASSGFYGDFGSGVIVPPVHGIIAQIAITVKTVDRIKSACVNEGIKVFFLIGNVVDIQHRNSDSVFCDQVFVEKQMFCIFFHRFGTAGQVIAFASGGTEFVFQLNDDDRTAVLDLTGLGDFNQFIVIFFRIFQILRVICSGFCTQFIHEPLGQTAVVKFPVNEGAHPVNAVHAAFCDRVDKRCQIAFSLKIKFSGSFLMISPNSINGNGIQSGCFHLQHAFFPVTARHAAIGEVASINKNRFSINFEIIFLYSQIHKITSSQYVIFFAGI